MAKRQLNSRVSSMHRLIVALEAVENGVLRRTVDRLVAASLFGELIQSLQFWVADARQSNDCPFQTCIGTRQNDSIHHLLSVVSGHWLRRPNSLSAAGLLAQ
eukprot:scaffold594281_cov42-Prasinocladus_malaysianus.AAC.2